MDTPQYVLAGAAAMLALILLLSIGLDKIYKLRDRVTNLEDEIYRRIQWQEKQSAYIKRQEAMIKDMHSLLYPPHNPAPEKPTRKKGGKQ